MSFVEGIYEDIGKGLERQSIDLNMYNRKERGGEQFGQNYRPRRPSIERFRQS